MVYRRVIVMNNQEKIKAIQNVIDNPVNEEVYFKLLEDIGDLKRNYGDYMTTSPINYDEELKRLPTADYELCTALLTMLLREDHFCEGSFIKRYETGQVDMILKRIIELLK